MLDLPGETFRQMLALGLVAMFVGAVKLVDGRYKQSAQSSVSTLDRPGGGSSPIVSGAIAPVGTAGTRGRG